MRHHRAPFVLTCLVALAGCDWLASKTKTRPLEGETGGTYEVPTGDPMGGPGGGTARITVSSCTACHGTPGFDNTNADPLVAAAPPKSLLGSEADPSVGAHRAHLVNGPIRNAVECASCHLVPTTSPPHPAQKQGKVTFSRIATTRWSGGAVAPTWNGTTCSSTYCHGNFRNGNVSNAPAWTGGPAGCGSCHGVSATNGPGGTHPTLGAGQGCGSCHGGTYTNTSVDPALHLNGVLDGGREPDGGVSCGGCHSALFAGMNGGVSHVSKHALGAVAGTNASPTDSGITWASPLSGNAAAVRSCVNMCHGDHPHDLTSPLTVTHENNAYLDAATSATRANGTASRIGVGGVGGTPNRTKTDYDGTQANGGLCTSCHKNPIQAGGPTVGVASFGASAHDYTANTVGADTYAWSYRLHDGGLFLRDCTKCHASNAEGTTPLVAAGGSAVHFGDNASLLSGTVNPAGTAAGFVCYNCHGSAASPAAGAQGNRSGKDIESQIARATVTGQSGHPSISDSVHDSAGEYASATFGNALGAPAGAGQRHASCLDCHDPHQARSGTHAEGTNVAGPPLEGAWGARLASDPAFWTAPTSADFVKTTIAAGTDLEATLCSKCHTAYYGTLPAAPSWSPDTWAETDVAREFNPNNVGNWAIAGTANWWDSGESAGSFHPVLASAGGNLGVTRNLLAPWTTASLMTCTDCHESDTTTDPGGPHGSAAKFVLKGPQTTWDATLTNFYWMPANAFCSNCHSTSWSSSRFLHGSNSHHVPCFNCHSAIVHGAPRPGFLNPMAGTETTILPAIAGYDNAAPYAQAGAWGRLFLKSYPPDQITDWSKDNCGCDGAGH